MSDDADAASTDAICRQLFLLIEAFPRFKDQVVDVMALEAAGAGGDGQQYAQNYAETSATPRGALILRGALKMLQVTAMITKNSKSTSTAERFKPLAGKSKWVSQSELAASLEGVSGQEGLSSLVSLYNPVKQFVLVVVVELPSGEVRCQHTTGTGVKSVDDRGPWEYVLDHGAARTSERPKFGYNGSLVPYRVSPDRPVPDHIPKPDYYLTGQAVAERQSEARNTPPVHTEKQIKKMRKANRLGREIIDAAHRIIKPGVTTCVHTPGAFEPLASLLARPPLLPPRCVVATPEV